MTRTKSITPLAAVVFCLGPFVSAGLPLSMLAAQQSQTPAMSAYAVAREQALAPALNALDHKQYEEALQQLEGVLQTYPNDSRVLMLTGNAARLCHQYDRAANAYQTAIAHAPRPPWPIHFSLVNTYAAMGQWEKFDAERQLIEESRHNGDPYLTKVSAYIIDEFDQGSSHVKAVEYLDRLGRFHVHYRFFVEPTGANPVPGQWTPHLDCESDDIDQLEFARTHPAEAAAGKRSSSLDIYLKPNTHATAKFYPEGEPSYQTVRQDVLNEVAKLR